MSPDTDVLENGRVGLPRWQWAVAAPVAVLVIVVLASQGRDWLVERGLRDEVSLVATVGLSAASMTPVGGSVNVIVAIRNTGPRQVEITEVDVSESRLQVRSASGPALRLAPGGTGEFAVSVRLDCTREGPRAGLRGTVGAIPLSGRRHRVTISVDRAFLITDVADTLCRVRPDLKDAELSGPVLMQ